MSKNIMERVNKKRDLMGFKNKRKDCKHMKNTVSYKSNNNTNLIVKQRWMYQMQIKISILKWTQLKISCSMECSFNHDIFFKYPF